MHTHKHTLPPSLSLTRIYTHFAEVKGEWDQREGTSKQNLRTCTHTNTLSRTLSLSNTFSLTLSLTHTHLESQGGWDQREAVSRPTLGCHQRRDTLLHLAYTYGAPTISTLLEIICLFRRISSLL